MFAKLIIVAAFVAATAHAGGFYGAPLIAAPAIKFAPIASSYQYETRLHSAPIAYATKIAAPLAYAAPIAKIAAPLAYHAPIAKVAAPLAYAAPALHVTHHSYAASPFLAAPKLFGAPYGVHAAPALW